MELIGRIRENPSDGSDFERLYDRYAPATFVFFLRKIGDAEAAADLNQELFLRLSRSIRRFEGRCSWKTWVFLVARHVLAEAREQRWRSLLDRTVTLDAAALAADIPLDASADARALETLLRARLARCLRRLGDVARAVVIGHYFEGVTLRELTERLALGNPSGSRGVLLAAQRKLRRCLEEREET